MHQLRHTAPPRTAAEQSLPGHFQTLRTGEDRAAHGGAGPGRSAAPLRLLHNRGRSGCSGFAPGRAARGSYRLTQARLPPRARRRTAARSHPAARSDASRRARHRRAPMSAAPRGPPRPRRSVPTSSPASVAHPRCGPAAAPRRSRCLVPSRPPQLPARLTEGAGSRAAPRRRRSPAAPPPAPARRQGALLAPTYRGDEGPGRRGRRGANRRVTKRGCGGRRASGLQPRSGLRGDVKGRGSRETR